MFCSSIQNNNVSKRLTRLVNYTAKFVKKNPNIIFIKADKSNVTVNSTYFLLIMSTLGDANTYVKITKNSINILTRKTRDLLLNWKMKNFITDQIYKKDCYVVKTTFLRFSEDTTEKLYPFKL